MSAHPLHVVASNKPISPKPAARTHAGSVGIIDIGSNSVRFVVFAGLSRAPVQLFNEKASCALGAGIQQTGRLNPDGRVAAVAAIGRFVRLARAMGIDHLDLLATAAVRDAVDGPDFVAELTTNYGVQVNILSGQDEAKLAAFGVQAGTPDAKGIVADLGGGSLELAEIDGLNEPPLGRMCSFPLGVLRLTDMANVSDQYLFSRIDEEFASEDWIKQTKVENLYAVGGAWRALAKLFMYQEKHPLQILDKYTMSYADAVELTSLVARLGKRSLIKIPGISRRRLEVLHLAAKLLLKLLQQVRPAKLVFSVHGMREGYYFSKLPTEIHDRDPIEDVCLTLAGDGHRFRQQPSRLMEFMDPLFLNETEKQKRQRYAACMLGDLYWDEHPDYRGQQAFFKTLRLPIVGFDHEDRAALALMVLYRYQNYDEIHDAQDAMALLDASDHIRVKAVGCALRLAHAVSGGAPGILKHCKIKADDGCLTLTVPVDDSAFYTAAFSKRLDRLARLLDLVPVIEQC